MEYQVKEMDIFDLPNNKICTYKPQILRLGIPSFVGGNPTLKVDKGGRSPFPYKRGPLPLD